VELEKLVSRYVGEHRYLYGYDDEENNLKCCYLRSENPKGRDHWEDLGVDAKILLE
jgi:hypothetical protein